MIDVMGMKYEMAGAIEGQCIRIKPPVNYGYIELISDNDNILLEKGEKLKTYEFHRYESTNKDAAFKTQYNGEELSIAKADKNMYAGFPHLHFYSNLNMAERFMKACIK
jgi:cobyrinic acid a,c-diamide synthase